LTQTAHPISASLRDPQQAAQNAAENQLRQLEAQRLEVIAQRRRRLLIVGMSLSLLCHLLLMLYLSMIYRGGGSGSGIGSGEAVFDFAIEDTQGLSELESAGLEDLVPDSGGIEQATASDVASASLDPAIPSLEKLGGAASMIPSLGASGGGSLGSGDGAGGGDGMGLGGGGGGGTSFFGVSSKGKRFAYIVDVSDSMRNDGKLPTAMRELARSIDALPDYSNFFVVLFSSGSVEPPGQRGWVRARKPAVRSVIRWLNEQDPGGGTLPRPAFVKVLSLEPRPDVIFFLTDGMLQDFDAAQCASLNAAGGKRAVINTIAFGDPSSQDALKQMAKDSGGVYRFVPSGAKK
jgi:hypothetical protein